MPDPDYKALLIKQLGVSLGRIRAELLVAKASAELGLHQGPVTLAEARAVMNKLAEELGVVGIAARKLRYGGSGSGESGAPMEVSAGRAPPSRSNGPRDPRGSTD
jgi:hypothetical protein